MAIFSDALVPDLISAVMSRMEGVRFTESAMTEVLSQLAVDMPEHAEKLEEISAFLVSAITFS